MSEDGVCYSILARGFPRLSPLYRPLDLPWRGKQSILLRQSTCQSLLLQVCPDKGLNLLSVFGVFVRIGLELLFKALCEDLCPVFRSVSRVAVHVPQWPYRG